MIENIKIREIRADEAKALSDLAIETYRDAFADAYPDEESLQESLDKRTPEIFYQMIEGEQIICLGAYLEGELIGFVALCDVITDNVFGCTPCLKDKQLKYFYVDKRYQSQGVGRLLMDAAFSHPYFSKAENIYLFVWEENKKAYPFYSQYGFKRVGTYKIYSKGVHVCDDLVMMRPLKL